MCWNKIADLHPIRKKKFWEAYNDFKEEHYTHNYLKKEILGCLAEPFTSKGLSIKYNRSQARIYDVLDLLKKDGKIINFRVKSKDYWIKKNQNILILSKIKQNYLKFLTNSEKNTQEFAKFFNVNWKSSFRRLKELEKLQIVKRNKDKTWRLLSMNKKVIII